ncbi:MAG: bifunctional phosphopantothenoylcysteine decarboxylase/phosphopantothenate--cysteine ligase CoaBC [Candidatus Nanopelagicales bacterium]|jgi:phosphopantothenoylcysteine decarboxylase / phosphopantothenate---cysteine ligase|nr:bifunctional phosphopantothenoylcysteine decarboxylase/phosphopantothenate--cysteine ligase CoaBC [Candidatus Nanopelagicales bacterium]MDP4666855.1 bifunctional phosphopantothenoylcysteine decarboxylase/phosphopantothenate--cysteine ligase CoaBC [Candidatus Nanopelagicales bacterium]MDP4895791.1 bifunctional phosphopantothenoylcysteine decarboxylase/phosphopantothenate--cysteine ligase CoaBC [Candidatus Nanopelagicales bacterium]MDP5050328.1 bifunctional phosphopantothenoylcysteine decarboxy
MNKSLNIVLGVSGGIAAYKVAYILRLLAEAGHNVHVVPTQASLNFVGSATWEALSGNPVNAQVWDDVAEVPHVRIGQAADLVIVAPATADLISRAASGAANDLLTNVLLTATCPIVFAPAMHTEMWLNPATKENVATLRSRGCLVIDPSDGRLTGDDSGPGRLPDPEEIVSVALGVLSEQDLLGQDIVITAGGTREFLDPVRFLGNSSSGKQGVALAISARNRGAKVTLICGSTSVPLPVGVEIVNVITGDDMLTAVLNCATNADVIVMAAAVADYKPKIRQTTKMKKSADGSVPSIELERTVDILADLVIHRDTSHPDQLIVGFAAETGDDKGSVLEHGIAKLQRKGCDLLVINEVGPNLAFGTDDNEVTILTRDPAAQLTIPKTSKTAIANAIWDTVISLQSHS